MSNYSRFFVAELEYEVACALIDGPDETVEMVASTLRVRDFHMDLPRDVADAAMKLWADGKARSITLVAEKAGINPDPVRKMYQQYRTVASPHALLSRVQRVAEVGAKRRLAMSMDELAANAWDLTLDEMRERVQVALEDALVPDDAPDPAVRAQELAERNFEHRWMVPDVLERGDRLILTGPEGKGKSTFLRQLAVQIAAGIHPFTHRYVDPACVLVVDLENSEPQTARSLQRLMSQANGKGECWVKNRTQGMDLRSTADQRWLDGLIRHHKPDVLVLGPLYKAFRAHGRSESKADETVSEEAAAVLDRLRVKYDLTLLLEMHSPHGDAGDRAGYRPYGASLWLRWPEFGFGLKPVGDRQAKLVEWRGPRDRDRRWPTEFTQGVVWPWEPM